jgi:hypothetical protein
VAAGIGVNEDNLSSNFNLRTQLSADVLAISVEFEIKSTF